MSPASQLTEGHVSISVLLSFDSSVVHFTVVLQLIHFIAC